MEGSIEQLPKGISAITYERPGMKGCVQDGCDVLRGRWYPIWLRTYFPKALGVLQTLAGLAYLLNSFVLLLLPSFADRASSVLLVSFIGELTTALWLAAKGVRVEAWDRMMLNCG